MKIIGRPIRLCAVGLRSTRVGRRTWPDQDVVFGNEFGTCAGQRILSLISLLHVALAILYK